MKIIEPSAELLWITPDAEKQIEKAARVCYKSEDRMTQESHKKFIKSLIDNEHSAMLEHACASIKFICDRGVSHELVRHRMASFAMESTRYCNYTKDKFDNEINVIKPELIEEEDHYSFWQDVCEISEEKYFILVGEHYGNRPEMARAVLPTCLKTEIIVTTNMREWRHIIKLRTSDRAHPQMRELMNMALNILSKQCPVVFEDLVDANLISVIEVEVKRNINEVKKIHQDVGLVLNRTLSYKHNLKAFDYFDNFKYNGFKTEPSYNSLKSPNMEISIKIDS